MRPHHGGSDRGALNRSSPCGRLSRLKVWRGVSDERFERVAAPSRGGLCGAEAGSPPWRRDNAHARLITRDFRARSPFFPSEVAKRRTHAAKRERVISVWGREGGAFSLNPSARQFRARPSDARGLRPPRGSSQVWTSFERSVGSRVQRGLDEPAWRTGIGVVDPCRKLDAGFLCGAHVACFHDV